MTRPSDKDILEALSASAALGGIVDLETNERVVGK